MILNTITSVISAFQKTALAGFLNMLGQLLALLIIKLATLWVAPSLVILCFAFVGSPVIVLFLSSLLFYCGRFKMVSPNIRYFNFGGEESFWNGSKVLSYSDSNNNTISIH